MKPRITFFFLIIVLSAYNTVLAASGGVETGKQKSAVCAACHGVDGNSLSFLYPKLAGQHSSYLLKQLRDYKNPKSGRSNPIMAPMVASLADQDIEDLALYFASQKTSENFAEPTKVSLGERLYRGGQLKNEIPACSGCHGPAGEGNTLARFPKLAGQHAKYTVEQLKLFRSAKRRNDANGMMRDVAIKMTSQEMEAVAQYIAGLYGEEK